MIYNRYCPQSIVLDLKEENLLVDNWLKLNEKTNNRHISDNWKSKSLLLNNRNPITSIGTSYSYNLKATDPDGYMQFFPLGSRIKNHIESPIT